MKISAYGVKLIAKREGVVLHVYLDTKKLPTAGCGHLLTADERKRFPVGSPITREQSDAWLAADLGEAEDAVNSAVHTELAQNEFDALVSLTFNIGVAGFTRSTVVRRLNAGDKVGAASAILLWNKPPEIQGRRRGEYNQFLTPYHLSAAAAPDTANPQNQSDVSAANSDPLPGDSANAPPPIATPKERVAVVKTKPKTWTQAIVAKITTAVTGNALVQWLWAQQDKLTGMSLPDAVWIIVSLTIAIGFLLWIIYEIIATYRWNKYQQAIDSLLVEQNSTADNLVQLIPADEVELYRARGFKIITRGEETSDQKT